MTSPKTPLARILVAAACVCLALLACSDDDDAIVVTGVDDFVGTDADESVTGTEGNDVLIGGDGADEIDALGGDDQVFGGFGDQLTGVPGKESGDDIINGGPGNDQLVGEQGNDTIDGGPDNDTLSGSEGDDSVTGGSGADTFIYILVIDDSGSWISDATSGGKDVIEDFEVGTDALIFFNRFNEAFTNPTRAEMLAAFGNPSQGFAVALESGDMVLTFTGGDTLTLRGSFGAAPASLEELETALGGPSSILYGAE